MNVTWGSLLDQYDLRAELYSGSERIALDGRSWEPNAADVTAAWKLAVELRTRIATQPLAFRDGDESAALKSVFGLFELFRTLAQADPSAHHFYELGLRVINQKLRPFTAKWHPVNKAGRLDTTDENLHFRTSLIGIQRVLRRFCSILEAMAGLPPIEHADAATPDSEPEFAAAIPLGVVVDTRDGKLAVVLKEELKAIRLRRAEAQGTDPVINGVGVALSGGGIRSATFALGVVSELARRGVMDDVDYLSTVSGGGYLGSFITSTVGNAPDSSTVTRTSFQHVFGRPHEPESEPVRAVRNHSKYLVEGGVQTFATIAGTVLYGLMTSALLLAPALLAAVALFGLVQPNEYAALVFALIGAAMLGVGYAIGQRRAVVQPPSKLAGFFWLGIGGLASFVAAALFAISTPTREVVANTTLCISLPVLAMASVWLLVQKPFPGSRRIATLAITWASSAALFATLLSVSARLDIQASGSVFAAAFLLGLLGLTVNLNSSSPHPFYKERIARTYLLDDRGMALPDRQPLSAVNASGKAPYHLIGAALNVPRSSRAELRGRRSDYFLFSKLFCGSVLSGFWPTNEWTVDGKPNKDHSNEIDLATAMAISGAAASPNMGRRSVRNYGYVLALLNLRLGYWLRKPRSKGWLFPHRYYYDEMRQTFDENLPFLNVSDGGHIENLGVFELLRRRCKFIVAVDGEADPGRSFEGFLHVVHLARVDLNIRIEPNLDRMRVNSEGIGRSHFELFRILYPNGYVGLMLYLKASLTGNEPETIRRYRAEHPDFPHESTSKQLYSEQQFEAYRLLGEHIASDLFNATLVGHAPVTKVGNWLRCLAHHFLRPGAE